MFVTRDQTVAMATGPSQASPPLDQPPDLVPRKAPRKGGRVTHHLVPQPSPPRIKQVTICPLLGLAAAMLLALDRLPANAAPSLGVTPTSDPTFVRIEIPGVHNAFQVTTKVYSGSQPEGAAAFAALASLGVKTIISVDGSPPEVTTARKHGLRYIHLPFGYDGVPTNRVVELAKAVASQADPVFVHCHHGLHRGPAAVAVICEATADWTTNQAVAWLREAGTAADYAGLYRSAVAFNQPTPAQLHAVQDLPEVARTSSLVEAMVAIDAHFDHLRQSQKAGWKSPPGPADISPPHEATMLWEQFREIARADDPANRTGDYRDRLTEAAKLVESLRKLLSATADHAALDAKFKQLGQNCAGCHKKYRNE